MKSYCESWSNELKKYIEKYMECLKLWIKKLRERHPIVDSPVPHCNILNEICEETHLGLLEKINELYFISINVFIGKIVKICDFVIFI